jgi:cytochrome c553
MKIDAGHGLSLLIMAMSFVASLARADDSPPAWAYVVNPPDFKLTPDDGKPRSVPGSSASYMVPQTRDRFLAPVWHPEDHPPLPDVVAHGRKPAVFACGFCHRADGPGGPENASLAGLPKAYIVQQMADFRNGLRGTAVPDRAPPALMISLAKGATDAEIDAAAAYFSSLKPRAVMRVVETDSVPQTYVAGWFLAAAKGGEKEPLGNRIIEIPEDLAQFENRDTHVQFIAYVPIGSVAKGKVLAGGNDKIAACAGCHGPDLKGVGDIPGIAGRSPSYIVRQLYDMKHGIRKGAASAPMQPIAEALSTDEMTVLAAYAASLQP